LLPVRGSSSDVRPGHLVLALGNPPRLPGTGRTIAALAERNQFGVSTGMLVVTVEPGGPAAKAGLLQGDVIVTFDGDPVPRLDPLFDALRDLEVGSTHRLQVFRAGQLKDLDIILGERP